MILIRFSCISLSSPRSLSLFAILFFSIPHFASPLNFSFQSFDPNSYSKIKLEGSAFFSSSQWAIELTKNTSNTATGSYGRALYYQPMRLFYKNSRKVTHFNTYFSFIINSRNSTSYADGMAFFLAAKAFPIPVDPMGSGLGLLNRDQTFNAQGRPFVAVEFDTYSNEWDPQAYKEHVGIDINSMKSVNATKWLCSVKDGKKVEAWISYSFTTKLLSATFTGTKGSSRVNENVIYEVDLRDHLPEWVTIGFSAATGLLSETHTLLSWNFNATAGILPKKSNHAGLTYGVVAGICVVAAVVSLAIWLTLKKKRYRGERPVDLILHQSMKEKLEHSTGPKKFSYKELARVTNNFSTKEKLGEGGFGGVFRGFLTDSNSYVAVKKISRESKQGLREYVSEVMIISRLRHRNLVQLVGWCHEKNEFLLVYEFMPNGSLDSHLFRGGNSLSWNVRYQIALDLASALLYLHEEWEECVLHRDIKSSNVLLDSTFRAKLGDFGLARLVDHEKGSRTTVLAGTMGYMAPEYATTGQARKESDVYSFGIVALEIACGRKPIDVMAEGGKVVMVNWVWELYSSGRLLEAADPRLHGDFDKQQTESLMMVGIWCAHPDYHLRPSIRQVIQVLKSEVPPPTLLLNMPLSGSFSHPDCRPSTPSCSYSNTLSDPKSYSSNVNVAQLTTSSTASPPESEAASKTTE